MTDIHIPAHSPLLHPDFCFGTATASFQIEGGAAFRDECIWDRFCQREGAIADGSNGDIACDHYHRWRDDLALLQTLGVDAYRFSVSWPRVMDAAGNLRQEGVDFYLRLLDELNQLGIKPFVTLYHWDLPQFLEDKGGWLNRETAYRFQDYVNKITQVFGNRVYSYVTLNEPFCSAYLGYEIGIHAPGIVGSENGKLAGHHLLLAHGLGLQVLKQNSPDTLNGIVLNITPAYPASDSVEDREAAKLADDMLNQWFFQPVLEGKYPEAVLAQFPADQSPIKDGDLALISQQNDFIGINYYSREIYQHDPVSGFVAITEKPNPLTDMGWEIYPQGLTDVLLQLHQQYSLPPIMITENGAAMVDEVQHGEVNDVERVRYIQEHLLALESAIKQGVDVRGYFAWSLLDNFEWAEGYKKRFGIVHVNYETQQRTLKQSGKAYRDMLMSRKC